MSINCELQQSQRWGQDENANSEDQGNKADMNKSFKFEAF